MAPLNNLMNTLMKNQPAPIINARHSKPWSAEEEAVLQSLYQSKGVIACCDALKGRSIHSIRKHVRVLGIEGPSGHHFLSGATISRGGKVWSEAEDTILRNLYASQGARACRDALPSRSMDSIHKHARVLGVVKSQG